MDTIIKETLTAKTRQGMKKDRKVTLYTCTALKRVTDNSGELRFKLERCAGGSLQKLVL